MLTDKIAVYEKTETLKQRKMKMNLNALKLIVFSIFILAFKQEDKQPTLQETLSWLKSKLEYSYEKQLGDCLHKENHFVKFDSQKHLLTVIDSNVFCGKFQITTQIINLSDIDPNSVYVKKLEPSNRFYQLKLKVTNNKEKIYYKLENEGEKTTTFYAGNYTLNIPDAIIENDENLPDRLTKALKRAATLSGGKKEAY